MTKQFTTGMWRPSAQLFVLWHFIFTSKTRHCCHKSVYNESVWRIPLRRRKTNKSWDWDLADKTDLSDVFKHRTGSYDKRGAELLWNLGVFFFFFLSQRSNKVWFTRTNISDSAIVRVLEVLRFCKAKKKKKLEGHGGFTSILRICRKKKIAISCALHQGKISPQITHSAHRDDTRESADETHPSLHPARGHVLTSISHVTDGIVVLNLECRQLEGSWVHSTNNHQINVATNAKLIKSLIWLNESNPNDTID